MFIPPLWPMSFLIENCPEETKEKVPPKVRPTRIFKFENSLLSGIFIHLISGKLCLLEVKIPKLKFQGLYFC